MFFSLSLSIRWITLTRFPYVGPSLLLWDEVYLVMENDVFEVFLDSEFKHFVEYICINVHEGNLVCNFLSLLNLCVWFEWPHKMNLAMFLLFLVHGII